MYRQTYPRGDAGVNGQPGPAAIGAGTDVAIETADIEPAFGLVLRPEIAALTMSGSSLIVAVNALLLKRLALPAPPAPGSTPAVIPEREPSRV
jgi:Cu2+-exporting ATPase